MTQTMQPPSTIAANINVPPQPQYELSNADKKRIQTIADAWQAYNGELDPPLEKMPGQPDDNVMTNVLAGPVDEGVNFLFGKELHISVDENAPEEAQQFLDDTWGREEKRIPLLQKLAMNGAMAGEAFLRIKPEPNGTFRLIPLDPATVFLQTDPQDCETVLLYHIEYHVPQRIPPSQQLQNVYYCEEIARNDPDKDGDDGNPFADVDATWTIQHWSRVGDRGNWTPAGKPISWPYPFPPVFQTQNLPMPNDIWGKPDITKDLIKVQVAINLLQSWINRTFKMFGNPILYANGMGDGTIDIKPGKIIRLPLQESKISAVAIPSDIANALAFLKNMYSNIDQQTGIPGVAMGRLEAEPRGPVSGVAIELMFLPATKKTEKKRCLYGGLIIDVSKALLVLNEMSPDIDVSLDWQDPLPHDNLQDVQAAVVKEELGVSKTTLLRQLGEDPEKEAELRKQEAQDELDNYGKGQGMPPASPFPPGLPGAPPLPGQTPPEPPPPVGAPPQAQAGGTKQ